MYDAGYHNVVNIDVSRYATIYRIPRLTLTSLVSILQR